MALNAKQEKALFHLNVDTDKKVEALKKKFEEDLLVIYQEADKQYRKIVPEASDE